jgi:signal transduction histidine kinase
MTMRAKVLLFAAVAIGIVAVMGGALLRNSSRGQWLRPRLSSLHEQLGIYSQMQHSTWTYLERLMRAQRGGKDTGVLLREHEQLIAQDTAKLEQALRQEQQEGFTDHPEELRYVEAIDRARRAWAEHAAQVAAAASKEAPPAPEVWWSLYAMFERDVGPHAARAESARHARLKVLRRQLDEVFENGQTLGHIIPPLCLVLVVLLAAVILVPMQGALRGLRTGAERIGRGDFDVELPATPRDELGALADAFNRMASELRENLKEKQRYNALLEETVRTRTAELEQANTRLADSLQQLQATQAKLLFADRLASMGQLAAGVGHEINNPLTYVLTNLNFVREELRHPGPSSEQERQQLLEAVEEAREGAERVRVIVQDLKTLSRPDDESSVPVDVPTVVRSAAKMASHEIHLRARLVEDCQDVPPVQGNPARLVQVLLNLLINAAHAIPEGQVAENEIRVVARPRDDGHVIIEVSDTGSGIPAEHLERIFDPFFTTKPVGKGTGLGLSVCHTIITALGGSIHVESQPGQGSTFRITLPVASDNATQVAA